MNKKANTRLKVEAADAVPQSLEDVNAAIAEIGHCQRTRDVIQAAMNEDLAKRRSTFETEAKPYADRIAELTRGVATYCEAHRDELTKGGKTKTARLATGEVSWRMRPISYRSSDLPPRRRAYSAANSAQLIEPPVPAET